MSSQSGAALQPGTLVATACLALLSVWRVADGAVGLAAVFAVLALANLGFGLWMARRHDAGAGAGVLPPPASAQAREEHDRQRRARAGWLRIALFGWVAAIGGAFFFPPLSLVLAALSLYATVRYVRSGHITRELKGDGHSG